MTKQISIIAMILVAGAVGYAQGQLPAIDPPVYSLSTNGTLHIRLNGALTDWLLGVNLAPAGGAAKVQVFEMDRDFKDASQKRIGAGFAKSVSYPAINVSGNTLQVNLESHDTATVYVEAPPWTNVVVTGPNGEVLYQTYLRKAVLVSRGVEIEGRTSGDFKMMLPWSDRTHEARVPRPLPPSARSILQQRQWGSDLAWDSSFAVGPH
jgi:hypothetical protein